MEPIMKKHYACSLFCFATAVAACSGQTLLFEDDFEDWRPENTFIPNSDIFYPEGFDGLEWRGKAGGGDAAPLPSHTFFRIDEDNIFGSGTSNTFLQFGNAGTVDIDGEQWIIGDQTRLENRNYSDLDDKTTLITTGVLAVAFDFYEPSTGSSNGIEVVDQRAFLRIRGDALDGRSTTNLNDFRIDNGIREADAGSDSGEPVTEEDTLYAIYAVFNHSGETVTYVGPDDSESTLEAGSADLWVDGQLAIAGQQNGDGFPSALIQRVFFEVDYPWGPTAAQEIWIDNWRVFDGVPLPAGEPVSLWADVPANELGWKDTSTADPGKYGVGWVFDGFWPWVFIFGLEQHGGGWVWLPPDSEDRGAFFAWAPSLQSWVFGSNDGWLYRFSPEGEAGWISL